MKEDQAQTADFSGTITTTETLGDEGTLYSFYPADAFEKSYSDGTVGINIPSAQYPSASSFDPDADVLVGRPSEYLYEEYMLVAEISFARILSMVRVKLSGDEFTEGMLVNSLKIQLADIENLTGRAQVSLAEITDGSNPIQKFNTSGNYVIAVYEEDFHPVIGGEDNSIFLMVNPLTVASGQQLFFTIDTDDYTITKTVDLTNDIIFPRGGVANITLSLNEENCAKKTSETRVYVESFDNVKTSKTSPEISKTGAQGIGITDATLYVYGTSDIRLNNNSQNGDSDNPYLYIQKLSDFEIDNLSVSELESLKFSAKTRVANSTSISTLTIQYKESSSSEWITADSWDVTAITTTFAEDLAILSIDKSWASLDLKFIAGNNPVLVDDMVLEAFEDNRTALDTPKVTLSVSDDVPNTIVASWDAIEGAASYDVTATPAEGDAVSANVKETGYTFTSLSYETEYTVSVVAKSSDKAKYYDSEAGKEVATTGAKPDGSYKVVITPTTTSAASVSGDAPEGSTVTFKNTYTNAQQMTSGKSQTYTLSGYSDCCIKSIVLSMRSNTSKGAGTLSVKAGDITLAQIATETTFNEWYNMTAFSTSYLDVNVDLLNEEYVISDGEDVVIVIAATVNSLYCQSVTIEYQK